MTEHKFKLGQTLLFKPLRSSGARGGQCKVTRLVSGEGNEPQYRVKCTNETFERMVLESELG